MTDRLYGTPADGCASCGHGKGNAMTLDDYLETFDAGEPAGDLARHVVELLAENADLLRKLREIERLCRGVSP